MLDINKIEARRNLAGTCKGCERASQNCHNLSDNNCVRSLLDLRDCLAEIKRLQSAVEASKDCDLVDGEPCPDVKRICDTCEHNGYPAAVRKALEPK